MSDLSAAITRAGVSGGVRKLGSFAAKALFIVAVLDTASLQTTEASNIEETRAGYSQTFTRVGVSGGVKRYGAFVKATETTAYVVVSDSADLSATEDPTDRNEIATGDAARLRTTETTALFNFTAVSDSPQLSVSETIGLVISGVTLKTASDSADLSATDVAIVGVSIDVTDVAEIDASDASDIEATAETVAVSDAASLAVDESILLSIFAGIVSINAQDTASLKGAELASAVEVRRIRRITMEIIHPHIEIVIQ